MKAYAISLILFWIIIIMFPDIISYLIAGFLIYSWIVLLFISYSLWKKEPWVKMWKFKIVKE